METIPFSAYEPCEKLSPFEIKDKPTSLAKESARRLTLTLSNTGGGNPNWIGTTPREAFFLLGQFSIEESNRLLDRPDLACMPQSSGIAGRLEAFLKAHDDAPGAAMLSAMVPFVVQRFDFEPDAFVHELVDSIIGDNYPVPDRVLVHAERVVHEYLMWAVCGGRLPEGKFDPFAVGGCTAAMCYTIKSLMQNHILRRGDTIALGAPISTRCIEMGEFSDYEFNVVHIRATQENGFQYSSDELNKLADPSIKAFLIVNPGNPSSVAISQDVINRLVKLVKTKRPDLIILTDDVYGVFVKGSRSLVAELPHNTIGVYDDIGRIVRSVAASYVEAYRSAKKASPSEGQLA